MSNIGISTLAAGIVTTAQDTGIDPVDVQAALLLAFYTIRAMRSAKCSCDACGRGLDKATPEDLKPYEEAGARLAGELWELPQAGAN